MLGKGAPIWASQAERGARVVTYARECRSGRIDYSPNSSALLGIPPSSSVDVWRSLISTEDKQHVDHVLRTLAPEMPSYEIQYRFSNPVSGRNALVLDRGEAHFDGADGAAYLYGALIDIEGHASVEGEFRKAARLRSVVFEAARMAAWQYDPKSGHFTGTDELLVLMEIERSQFLNTLASIAEAIHPDDVGAWEAAHAVALTPGGRMEVEFRVPLRHGGVRWLLSRGEVIRGRDGGAIEAYGVMIDITQRKQAEEDAARLAAIVESSDDAIISKSLQGIVVSWNSGAERLLGFTAKEMIGGPIERVLPLHLEHEESRILSTIGRGESIPPFESVRKHKSGRGVHVSIAVSPIRNANGRVIGASTIARDITERRRNIEVLRENESRLRLALRSAHAGVWNFDFAARELDWSPEMHVLYGRGGDQNTPKRAGLVAQIPLKHRARAQRSFARALLQGGAFTLEFPIIRPDGSEIWTAIAGDVIQDARGRPISARGIDQDITERKNWEKRQAVLLRELSHRVKNTLAVIQSVARQTLRSSHNPRDFVEAFDGRIQSLAASHNLLTEVNWEGAALTAIIHSQLAALVMDFGRQITLQGPEIKFGPEQATQLGLVIHELAVNAAKFGALSVPQGNVRVIWSTSRNRLRLIWRERGGPPITSHPAHSGFGTALIQSSAIKVKRFFARQGLTCRLELAI